MRPALSASLPLALLACLACGSGGDGKGEAVAETAEASAGSTEASVADAPDAAAPALCDDLVGTAWRFTSIYATEPDDPDSDTDAAVRDILNELFARYIDAGVLNVVYEVEAWDPTSGDLMVRSGPAMRYPDGKLHPLCGYDAHMPMRVEGVGFRTTRPETLAIHCGTTDAPATCSPEASAPNAVPITGLDTQRAFRLDCRTGTGVIEGASLLGYIGVDDAERICICTMFEPATGADLCTRKPTPGASLYCKAHCGTTGFAHFGTVLREVAKITPGTYQGTPAYRFAGTYSAERVDDYDPRCCTSPDSSP